MMYFFPHPGPSSTYSLSGSADRSNANRRFMGTDTTHELKQKPYRLSIIISRDWARGAHESTWRYACLNLLCIGISQSHRHTHPSTNNAAAAVLLPISDNWRARALAFTMNKNYPFYYYLQRALSSVANTPNQNAC